MLYFSKFLLYIFIHFRLPWKPKADLDLNFQPENVLIALINCFSLVTQGLLSLFGVRPLVAGVFSLGHTSVCS